MTGIKEMTKRKKGLGKRTKQTISKKINNTKGKWEE